MIKNYRVSLENYLKLAIAPTHASLLARVGDWCGGTDDETWRPRDQPNSNRRKRACISIKFRQRFIVNTTGSVSNRSARGGLGPDAEQPGQARLVVSPRGRDSLHPVLLLFFFQVYALVARLLHRLQVDVEWRLSVKIYQTCKFCFIWRLLYKYCLC